MSKSKLEILLEEVGKLSCFNGPLADAYQAVMYERKTMPQPGQDIEVTFGHEFTDKPHKENFVGFSKSGLPVTEDDKGNVTTWTNYRIPTPKKKFKVVKGDSGPFVLEFSVETDCPIITTFED